MTKKLIPCIYLKDGAAVKSFTDLTVINPDAVLEAVKFSDALCDEIIVFDLSKGDEEHEKALDVIKDICKYVKVPVIGAGNVKRMEDIKKLLYAGCKQACLNYSLLSNVEITEEVSKKFGKDKIIACIKSKEEYIDNKSLINDYVSYVLIVDPSIELSAEELNGNKAIISLSDVSLDKLIEYVKDERFVGVTGPIISDNYTEYANIRDLCGIKLTSFSEFKLNENGLIPCIVQDYKTNEVLMMAYMNEEAYNDTVRSRMMHYYSRSRNEQWLKGETSGHYQYVKSLHYDCDADTLLAKVEQIGAACHTGSYSCFFNEIIGYEFDEKNPFDVLADVYDVIADRKVNPKEGSYTNYLFDKGVDKILKKCGEEATEIVIAAKNPNPNEIKYEISDFLYHVMVLMVEKGVTWEEIMIELANR